ncbi:MAG: LysE family translocator [Candidatus Bathyarchaeota archaeon]|nr:LysE family translocator [Candidatus Bathyarchaeota archaeon]
MELGFLVSGIVIGFSIAAPVGPIGVLCIRRTLADGRLNGLVSGLGAATADAVYGSIAAFGLTVISNLLIQQQMWLRLFGGAFLIFLGAKTFFSKPPETSTHENRKGLMTAYGSTFFLTLTNPVTILSFAAIFAGIGLGSTVADYGSAALLVFSVFAGSALWWLILSGTVSLLRKKVTQRVLQWINRTSGAIIVGFGAFILISLLF